MPRAPIADIPPHSWPVSEWTERAGHVYPHTTEKGNYLARTHQNELLACSALVRVGRDRVIIGAAYAKWLASQGSKVAGYEVAANRPRDVA
jgi:hypothetical protein